MEVYGGPRYRCERGVKRPSRESLGATLVSVAKRLAEQHFVVFFALSTWWVYRLWGPGLTSLPRSLSDRSHAMLPAPMTRSASANTYARQRYLLAWDILCQILWEFGGQYLFIYKQIFSLLIKCANHWDKRTFCFTSSWLAHIHLCDKRDNNSVWNNLTPNLTFLLTDVFAKTRKHWF